jgi:hypothetical protein
VANFIDASFTDDFVRNAGLINSVDGWKVTELAVDDSSFACMVTGNMLTQGYESLEL